VHLIALTGGIASGKSTVAARLAEHGAVVVDADRLAREVVEPGEPALAAIVDRFGASVIQDDGNLDRAALGSIVFADERARRDLNAITHPAVWRRALQLFADAEHRDPNAVVVYDVPLLVEAADDRPMRFDLIVVVHAPKDVRVRRLVEIRGIAPQDAVARVNAQASDDERLSVADVVIDATGSMQHTIDQADALWERLVDSAETE
jgi:dephospho-CoA kinase